MSGGHFGNDQFRIYGIAEEIDRLIETNECAEKNEWGDTIGRFYSEETIDLFKEAHTTLLKASVYAQRIDWLVSGDDGQESFVKRLKKELAQIKEAS